MSCAVSVAQNIILLMLLNCLSGGRRSVAELIGPMHSKLALSSLSSLRQEQGAQMSTENYIYDHRNLLTDKPAFAATVAETRSVESFQQIDKIEDSFRVLHRRKKLYDS